MPIYIADLAVDPRHPSGISLDDCRAILDTSENQTVPASREAGHARQHADGGPHGFAPAYLERSAHSVFLSHLEQSEALLSVLQRSGTRRRLLTLSAGRTSTLVIHSKPPVAGQGMRVMMDGMRIPGEFIHDSAGTCLVCAVAPDGRFHVTTFYPELDGPDLLAANPLADQLVYVDGDGFLYDLDGREIAHPGPRRQQQEAIPNYRNMIGNLYR